MSKVQYSDNFLSENEFIELNKVLYSSNFPWFAGKVLHDNESIVDNKYNFQLYHSFFLNPTTTSNFLSVVEPLYTKLNAGILSRIKANLNPATDKNIEHGMHIDTQDENIAKVQTTAVYYVNTNNGYTLFEDGTKINSVANRIVKFPSYMKHTGSTSTDTQRIVINLNYIEK